MAVNVEQRAVPMLSYENVGEAEDGSTRLSSCYVMLTKKK